MYRREQELRDARAHVDNIDEEQEYVKNTKNNVLFCTKCGSILSEMSITGPVTCSLCYTQHQPQDTLQYTKYTIMFHPLDIDKPNNNNKIKQELDNDGPTVERRCPSCNNDIMSYATLQLRSADEGQTVFYTCTRCKYKESENS